MRRHNYEITFSLFRRIDNCLVRTFMFNAHQFASYIRCTGSISRYVKMLRCKRSNMLFVLFNDPRLKCRYIEWRCPEFC
jgi:hypothetical protein